MATTPGRPGDIGLRAKLFRGLGDASRLALLEALRGGPRSVSQLVARTGLSQPNASMHLSCLHCCGLVTRTERGRHVYYRQRVRETGALLAAAERLLRVVSDEVAACARYAGRSRRAHRPRRGRASA